MSIFTHRERARRHFVSATAHCDAQVSSTRVLKALTGNFARQTEETRTVNCGNELRKRSDRNADALLNVLNIERITAKDANADHSAASAIGSELQVPRLRVSLDRRVEATRPTTRSEVRGEYQIARHHD